jgi:hypothetical protein
MRFTVATTLAALSSTTLAHGGVTRYIIEGKTYDGYAYNLELRRSSTNEQTPLSDLPATNGRTPLKAKAT